MVWQVFKVLVHHVYVLCKAHCSGTTCRKHNSCLHHKCTMCSTAPIIHTLDMDLRGCLRLCTIDCSVGEFVMQENQSTIAGGASCTFQPQGPHNIKPTSRVARYIITASTGAHPPPMQHPESAQPTLYHVSRLTSHRILHRNDHGASHLSEAHMTCWSQLSSSFP